MKSTISQKEKPLMPSDVKTTLNAIKRAIGYSPTVNSENKSLTRLEAEHGMTKVSEASLKSAIDLFYAIVTADGELGAPEEEYFSTELQKLEFEKLLDQEAYQNYIKYKEEATVKAKEGYYKKLDIEILVNKHIENTLNLGYSEDFAKKGGPNFFLLLAITAASTDGYAKEEAEAVEKVAKTLKVDKNTLGIIQNFVKLERAIANNPELEHDNAFKTELSELFMTANSQFGNEAIKEESEPNDLSQKVEETTDLAGQITEDTDL